MNDVDADIVCLQEVAPVSFEEDFAFMKDLGYDGKEMFKKGRFRPATFWKTSQYQLASPPVHKDRTLLTAFRPVVVVAKEETSAHTIDGQARETEKSKGKKQSGVETTEARTWYVLNCHLQAGKQANRRVRQINEERNPERNIPLIVCGDFNGGPECGAVRYLEDGFIDETFIEDGEPVTSSKKDLPLEKPMLDVMACVPDREPPPTLVVSELISTLVQGGTYENPTLSVDAVTRLTRVFERLASHDIGRDNGNSSQKVMNRQEVEKWLIAINGELGRGSEFREAARQMGWRDNDGNESSSSSDEEKVRITLPPDGILTLEGFLNVYQAELRHGKFWGIAHDMAVLGEPLPDKGVFTSRFDRMYCSSTSIEPIAVMDFFCSRPCPNDVEPSDHLPIAAKFAIIQK